MKKLLLISLGILLLILLLVIAASGYLLGTQSGFNQLLSLAQKHLPGELSWQQAEGPLLKRLDLDQLNYTQADGLRLEIASARLRWKAGDLLGKRLTIDQLHMQGVKIYLPERQETPEAEVEAGPLELPDFRLPLTFNLQDLDLQGIRIYPHGAEEPIHIDTIKLVAAGEGETLQLINLELHSPEAALAISGQLNPLGAYPVDLATSWHYDHPRYGTFSGNGSLNGELKERVSLIQKIEGAVSLAVDSTIDKPLDTPDWQAEISAKSSDLGIFSPELEGSPLTATLLSKGNPNAFTLTGQMQTAMAQTGVAELELDAQGNTQQLTLDKLVLALVDAEAELQLTGQLDLERQAVDLEGQWQRLGWPLLGERDYELEAGNLHLVGGMENLKASVESSLAGALLGHQQLVLEAQLGGKEITLKTLSVISDDQSQQLEASGRYELKKQTFATKGNWSNLSWPMTGDADYSSPQGKFEAGGKLADYQFQLEAEAAGEAIPTGSWRVNGQGSDQALKRFDVQGSTLDGQIAAIGAASWAPDLSWKTELTLQGINPGVHWPSVPGRVDAHIESEGAITDQVAEIQAAIRALSGKLRGQPLVGGGALSIKGQDIDVDNLQVQLGQAKVSASGVLSKNSDLKWQLQVPALEELLPDASGRVSGQGTLKGSRELPAGALSLDIQNLALKGTTIKSLTGTGMIDLSGGRKSTLTFEGQDIAAAGTSWETFTLNGSGVPEQHELSLALSGELADLALSASGGQQGDSWRGMLTELAALKTDFGDWTLKEPAPMTLSAQQASVSDLCLQSSPTEACMIGSWSLADGSTGELALIELKPERFKAYLPGGLKLDSALSGKASGRVSAKGAVHVQADFRLSAGQLFWDGGGEPVDVALEESSVTASLKRDRLKTLLDLNLGRLGNMQSEVGISNLSGQRNLSGQLSGDIVDLSLISAFAPQLQDVAGELSADLMLGGTVATPKLLGRLSLEDFSAEVPQVALRLEDTALRLESDGDGPLRIQGHSRSGEGRLELSGSVDPATQALSLRVDGEDYQVANSRTLKAEISPEMEIAMDSEGMSVEGELHVPMAYINARGASGETVVSSSSDLVVVAENGETPEETVASRISVNLRVLLGDDIVVEAADFSGGLKGSLLVEQSPELAPRGTGTIEVVKGDYVVYGQKLSIQRGKILFGGGPIDNPRLDMEVARRVEAYDVLAGARIGGTAQAPLLQLYSEPAMPDASILSYMLLGQPPGTKGGSFTLGKYITPDLYVSYGIGLFDAINTFNLRYRLTEKLALHAASGLASSADLVYTFER